MPPFARAAYRMLLIGLSTVVLAFVAVLGWLYVRQEALLFYPQVLAPAYRPTLAGVSERLIEVDGAVLSALHFRQPDAKGVVFFLHGNGGNVDSWLTGTDFYERTGYDVFMLDYRGFGKSSGRITGEAQMHADVLAAWKSIEREYAGRKNVIYGRSLGSGLAAKLAATLSQDPQPGASLLVLVSPYSSLQAMAAEVYPWVPGFLMRYPMRTDEWLAAVKMPMLIIHGERDELIAAAHAHTLHALKPDATLVVLPEAGHNDVHLFEGYIELLEQRLKAL